MRHRSEMAQASRSADPDSAVVALIGNVNLDVIVRPASKLPPPGTEWTVERIEARTGGAAAIAALTLSHLGAPPLLVGCLGNDSTAAMIRDELSRAGIEQRITSIEDAHTGVSVAFEASDHERSFLTALGSLALFEPTMIPSEAFTSKVALLCGYFLLPALRGEPSRELLRRLKVARGWTLFDPGWDPDDWPQETVREIHSLLPFVDVLLPNEAEATALTGDTDPMVAARQLQRLSGGWVVVKRGAGGCLAIGPAGREERVDAPKVTAHDTTGAGDAFNAALIYALTHGSDWGDCLRLAVRVASTVVSRTGRRYPTLADVLP
jgi:sugar/nucleoside kinase (ribokinase family)